MRLIDADALVKVVNDDIDRCYQLGFGRISGAVGPLCHFVDEINDLPTIDAAPVVHARWVKAHGMMPPEYHHRKQCDMCGGWALQDYFGRERLSHYCPTCGAKMDGGAKDDV